MSTMEIGVEALPEFKAGNGSVDTTEIPLSLAFKVYKHVVVRADSGNGNTIKVGPVGYAANGFILNAGEQTPPIYIDSLDKIGVIGGANGQIFSWVSS
jgi:hypothetical protein